MKLHTLVASVLMATCTIFTTAAVAAPKFPAAVIVADGEDDSVYMTTWTAYPVRNDYNKTVVLYAEGKTSSFEGIISLDCKQPIHSTIEATSEYYSPHINSSLKKAMADNVIPRLVVNNMFAKFCK